MAWQAEFAGKFNMLPIMKSDRNCLNTESAADFLQVHNISINQFLRRIGTLEAEQVEEIVAGVVIALDFRP